MNWDTSCPDWAERIVDGRSLISSPPLFPDEATEALKVFKSLRLVDVIGCPTFEEAGADWIFDFVSAVFGAYDPKTKRRLIREFFLCVSKKNGKSSIAAGIMLTALIRNRRRSNELLIVAPTVEAAQNSFNPAKDMVRAEPRLDASQGGSLHIIENQRTIKHLVTGAVLKIVAADSQTVVGKKAAFVLIDELWEFGKQAKADAMLREATGGLVSRPEGFVISITTQADEPPAGVFRDKLQYARDVRDGRVEDRKFLPVIYEFPKAMLDAQAHLEPENFHITNPNIGRSVSREWLEDELRKEMQKDASTRNTFLAKHLNIEIGLNLASDRWAGAEFWKAAEDPNITLEWMLDHCEVIVPGVDGGGLDDLFGFALLGRVSGTADWVAWCHAWCHQSVLDRRKSIASKLKQFEAAGELTIVDDKLEDLVQIVEIIVRVRDAGLLGCVALDIEGPYGELVDALALENITEENGQIIGVPQGYKLMNAIKTTERKLANGTLKHAKSDLMDWCVGNVKIEPTATAIRATKQNAGDAKIDPWGALMDAATVMIRNPVAQAPIKSPWEDENFRMWAGLKPDVAIQQ